MKKLTTLALILLGTLTGISQNDSTGESRSVSQVNTQLSEKLIQLYQEAKALESNGTAAEINANIAATKEAWAEINPDIAALYKPINNEGLYADTEENLAINGIYIPEEVKERDQPSVPTRDWAEDHLLMDDWVDGGVDIEVTGDGDIYISAYQNDIENEGATFDEIIIFRSLDGGSSWEEWQRANVTAPMRKMEIVSIDGSGGDEYLVAYLITTSENFQAWRWNTATGAFDAEVIDSDVSDFSVDRNYPAATVAHRVFATYLKETSCTEVYSARSTAGDYGFNWVDAVSIDNVCGQQVDFAYGLNGGCYTTYTGASSGSLFVNTNNNYNDPASWTARETVESGATKETLNPTIAAARLEIASDKVVVWASSRNAGTTGNFDGIGYSRISGAPFSVFSNFGSGGTNWNVAHTDSWVRKENANETIRLSYVRDNIDNSADDTNRSLTFNGTGFDPFDPVADTGVNVWDGFPSATAETSDDLPCMTFAGTSSGGGFGYGLYFDAESEIVFGIEDNLVEGLSFAPNPVQNELNISAKQALDAVSVYNILGAQIATYSPNTERTQINTSNLSAGIYLVKVTSGGSNQTFKIVKN